MLDPEQVRAIRERAAAERERVLLLTTDMAKETYRRLMDEGADPITFMSDLTALMCEDQYDSGYVEGLADGRVGR